MFVVEIVATLTTILFFRDLVTGGRRSRLLVPDQSLALVHGGVRQFRRSRRRRPRQGAGGLAAQDQDRHDGEAARCQARKHWRSVAATSLKQGDVVLVEAGDLIPSDGDVIEGVASVNEAAITGESAPVIRESGGDRSAVTGGTTGHFRLDQGEDHRRSGPHLPRPHDRAGRRRRAPEDAQRDRAQHPAGRHDDHLRLCGRDDSELRRLCRRPHLACWCWWRCS